MSWLKPREGKHQYPLIDSDPHASRVIRYMRPGDYVTWAAYTAGTPGVFWVWEQIDRTGFRLKPQLWLGATLGFGAGFLIAYQRSSMRFWGWTENAREEARDLEELTQRAREGKPLYGESSQPAWVQAAAHRNSQYSQLKFSLFPMLNLVNHPYHGTDPAKYGVQAEPAILESHEGLRPGEILRTKGPKALLEKQRRSEES
ncbi:NADH-ubiquinone oxidoreductase complex I, 21 kDa subunit-domain-containing protein [Mycena belliarum]|uniref:NADH-ubiquinone oxidoreductase complex I, 21 kDa subunit-domain-containing protein n=1 Tax=Mycena belliarum TaxID=1033014 RepID=A0AAD6U8X0_9AGAR|nr:NADH-ubiquinone oxidoreductase complex I, 21 kDa subunit-domain-containing protein [Mycena belliae]